MTADTAMSQVLANRELDCPAADWPVVRARLLQAVGEEWADCRLCRLLAVREIRRGDSRHGQPEGAPDVPHQT